MQNNADTKTCLSCMHEIGKKERTIQCDGACGELIHIDCAHLTDTATKAINDFDNIQYICDTCVNFSLRSINNKLNGIYQFLYNIIDSSKKSDAELATIKNEMQKMNQKIT